MDLDPGRESLSTIDQDHYQKAILRNEFAKKKRPMSYEEQESLAERGGENWQADQFSQEPYTTWFLTVHIILHKEYKSNSLGLTAKKSFCIIIEEQSDGNLVLL